MKDLTLDHNQNPFKFFLEWTKLDEMADSLKQKKFNLIVTKIYHNKILKHSS